MAGNQMYFLVFGKTVPYAMKGKAIELHTHIEEGQTFGELAFFEVSNLHRMSMVCSPQLYAILVHIVKVRILSTEISRIFGT